MEIKNVNYVDKNKESTPRDNSLTNIPENAFANKNENPLESEFDLQKPQTHLSQDNSKQSQSNLPTEENLIENNLLKSNPVTNGTKAVSKIKEQSLYFRNTYEIATFFGFVSKEKDFVFQEVNVRLINGYYFFVKNDQEYLIIPEITYIFRNGDVIVEYMRDDSLSGWRKNFINKGCDYDDFVKFFRKFRDKYILSYFDIYKSFVCLCEYGHKDEKFMLNLMVYFKKYMITIQYKRFFDINDFCGEDEINILKFFIEKDKQSGEYDYLEKTDFIKFHKDIRNELKMENKIKKPADGLLFDIYEGKDCTFMFPDIYGIDVTIVENIAQIRVYNVEYNDYTDYNISQENWNYVSALISVMKYDDKEKITFVKHVLSFFSDKSSSTETLPNSSEKVEEVNILKVAKLLYHSTLYGGNQTDYSSTFWFDRDIYNDSILDVSLTNPLVSLCLMFPKETKTFGTYEGNNKVNFVEFISNSIIVNEIEFHWQCYYMAKDGTIYCSDDPSKEFKNLLTFANYLKTINKDIGNFVSAKPEKENYDKNNCLLYSLYFYIFYILLDNNRRKSKYMLLNNSPKVLRYFEEIKLTSYVLTDENLRMSRLFLIEKVCTQLSIYYSIIASDRGITFNNKKIEDFLSFEYSVNKMHSLHIENDVDFVDIFDGLSKKSFLAMYFFYTLSRIDAYVYNEDIFPNWSIDKMESYSNYSCCESKALTYLLKSVLQMGPNILKSMKCDDYKETVADSVIVKIYQCIKNIPGFKGIYNKDLNDVLKELKSLKIIGKLLILYEDLSKELLIKFDDNFFSDTDNRGLDANIKCRQLLLDLQNFNSILFDLNEDKLVLWRSDAKQLTIEFEDDIGKVFYTRSEDRKDLTDENNATEYFNDIREKFAKRRQNTIIYSRNSLSEEKSFFSLYILCIIGIIIIIYLIIDAVLG